MYEYLVHEIEHMNIQVPKNSVLMPNVLEVRKFLYD
jgi:hypothetical protein